MELSSPDEIFCVNPDFEAIAARTWTFQSESNPVLAEFLSLTGENEMIFLPISLFRNHDVVSAPGWEPEIVFQSSGTTGSERSRHLVRDKSLYFRSAIGGFRHFYGEGEFLVLALLPHYLEQGGSSLVFMVNAWMDEFGLEGSGFFMNDFDALRTAITDAMAADQRILLIGVSYALLDFAERYPVNLPENAIVMETGGMKGRKKELIRKVLHAKLANGFGVKKIHSEYGMTELLSQAYSLGDGLFRCAPWMRVVITDPYIPGKELPAGQTGRINLIDLANQHSCAFIRTDDLGRMHADGSFEVIGRLDNAELRGCNLLYV